MNRLIFIACLAAVATACDRNAEGLNSELTQNNAASVADSQPQYASEAQRARAKNYWLLQNQLPADAGVASAGSGG